MRVSRCTQPQSVPLDWLLARDRPGEHPFVIAEMSSTFEGRPAVDKQLLFAALNDRMLQASNGLLEFPADVDESRQDPVVWELRWEVDDMLCRLYFGEPAHDLTLLVALLFHHKGERGRKVMSSSEQTQLHKQAAKRYHEGKASNWGNI
jgi:hypothetical protein